MSSTTTTCAASPSSLLSCSAVTEHDTSVATPGVVDCNTNAQFGCILRQTFRNAITCKTYNKLLCVATIVPINYILLHFVSVQFGPKFQNCIDRCNALIANLIATLYDGK